MNVVKLTNADIVYLKKLLEIEVDLYYDDEDGVPDHLLRLVENLGLSEEMFLNDK